MPVRLLVALLLLLPAACTAPAPRPGADVTTFVLVRHAEKGAGEDPGLSDTGRARAHRLARLFAARDVAAVYATAYRRTRQTAEPIAARHRIATRTYDAGEEATRFAQRLQQTHTGGTVVVVGHSNTVPAIAARLCRCEVAPMGEQEYDRLIEVTVAPDGTPTLRQSRHP